MSQKLLLFIYNFIVEPLSDKNDNKKSQIRKIKILEIHGLRDVTAEIDDGISIYKKRIIIPWSWILI